MVLVCYLGIMCFPNLVKENMPYSRIYCEFLNFVKFTNSEVLAKIHPVEIRAKLVIVTLALVCTIYS